jgi:RNA polymerase sigma-70 factor (ECF subfamily)
MDDSTLIRGIEMGDPKAFETLFSKYYTVLVVFALKIVKDEDLARELVQDVFVNFFEKRNSLHIHTSLKSHLYQSVKNKCLNHIKREQLIKGHHQNILMDNQNTDAYIENKMEETELESKMHQIIETLPDKCREIFELSRFEGKTNQEIADQFSLSKRTVETQISKALKILRENISDLLTIGLTLSIGIQQVFNSFT